MLLGNYASSSESEPEEKAEEVVVEVEKDEKKSKRHKKDKSDKKKDKKKEFKLPSPEELLSLAASETPDFLVNKASADADVELFTETKKTEEKVVLPFVPPIVPVKIFSDEDLLARARGQEKAKKDRENFKARENRKRAIGQSSRGSNYVENEKRTLRESTREL